MVRHGETDWNREIRIQGQTDIPLNANGFMQAKAFASRLMGESSLWNGIITSDLNRAKTTGSIIAEALRIPILGEDIRLRERYFGEIEGTTEEERLQKWGENWRSLDLGKETDVEMRQRGKEAIDDIVKQYGDRNILIVSHGSFIAHLLLELCKTIEDQRLNNLSYSILEHNELGWHMKLHNCNKHLTS